MNRIMQYWATWSLPTVLALGVSVMPLWSPPASAQSSAPGTVRKLGVDLDVRSLGRMMRDRRALAGTLVPQDQSSVVPQLSTLGPVPPIDSAGNVQVNDSHLDNIVTLNGTRPFVSFTQSETALAIDGRNMVAAYNTSASATLVKQGQSFAYTQLLVFGFSNSTDGGHIWTSGFLPPVRGSSFTDGDPSVAVDRRGHFYAAGLGADAASRPTVQVNTSRDGGRTWSDAVVVQQDDASDKSWMTVGPDPTLTNRDNVYVTWTSMQVGGWQLRFGRSIDGGATWRTQILPVSDPNLPARLSNSVPAVDTSTGILYIPFLHFGPASFEQDFIRILISADAGTTFSFATFNAPDAPNQDPTLLPVVPAGDVTDCGPSGGVRLTIHAGPDVSRGRNSLPRFVQAARVILQPAFAARHGRLYLAWSNATTTGGSDIRFMRSDDGGAHWTVPRQVNPPVAEDIQHVLPTLAINENPSDPQPTLAISYYTQHRDETVDVDTASSRDGGVSFAAVRLTGAPFALAPTNIPLHPAADTGNYDRTFFPCYNLGEYMSARVANGNSYVLWSDSRHLVTEPVNTHDPLSGQTHPQQDIFFQVVPVGSPRDE